MVVSFGVFLAVTCVVAVLVAVVTFLIFRARYARLKATADEPLTDIASRLISVLATAGLVVDESLTVLRATNSAIALGLVSGRVIRSPEIRTLVRETQESETTKSVDFELALSEGGDIRYLRARAVTIGAGVVLVLVEDNTEARDFESIRRDFIANVTHEIKTPIGAIALLSEAMEGALDDPTRMHKFADSLRRETRRLSTLITEIIQLSRVETSNILAKAKPANVGVVIREALERTLVIADAKDIVVNAKCPDDIFVMGDGELLTVAVKNLVENAIQYSDIIVTDQGVGIPAEEQSRVFERFYRVDESRDRTTGGTGLGLSLVKHIALSHRGEVTLFSQPGVGSTFTIRLPRLVDIAKENAHE